jgi:hypothetical protein
VGIINKIKYIYEDMERIFKENNLRVLISKKDYKTSSQLVNYECMICGHKSRASLSHVILGRGCKKCKKKINAEKQRNDFEEVATHSRDFSHELVATYVK